MPLMRYLVMVVLGGGAIVAFSVGFSWLFARRWCKPSRRLPTETPADHGLPFEPVTFTSQGVQLNGWFIHPNSNPAPRPAIVVAHGWSADAAQMLPVARLLHAAGFGVLLYDARGHGVSEDDGSITLLKFAEDLTAAVDYLVGRPEVDATRLGAVGHSMGGSAAIVATSTEPRIRALVSSSAFADPVILTRRVLRAHRIPRWPFLSLTRCFIERWTGTTMTDLAPQNRIGQIRVPVLLIHGESDRFIPPSNMETLCARACQKHTQSWLAPGRRHSDILLDLTYGERVIAFLGKHLVSGQQEHGSLN